MAAICQSHICSNQGYLLKADCFTVCMANLARFLQAAKWIRFCFFQLIWSAKLAIWSWLFRRQLQKRLPLIWRVCLSEFLFELLFVSPCLASPWKTKEFSQYSEIENRLSFDESTKVTLFPLSFHSGRRQFTEQPDTAIPRVPS